MLLKIVSGGQTGADIAGLDAARVHNIKTGGYAPKGWKTSTGSNPKLAEYGLIEHDGGYKERTWENVRISQATIRLAIDFYSPGELCTMNAIKHYNRHYLDINLKNPLPIDDVAHSIIKYGFQVINIAGNAEKYPDFSIYKKSFEYLNVLFNRVFFFCPF